jgi:ribosomal protein RSM22 (predicted rRNA methylase)
MITRFPRAWLWLVDELIPVYVKKKYSPQQSWQDRPFGKEDSQFFFRGIEELSELFTEERAKGMPAYFSHPKFRSSYLLYFLPLQAAKFLTLFQSHASAIDAALRSGRSSSVIKIADLGVGPGTASLSFLLHLLDLPAEEALPKIEFHWFDTQEAIMMDGKALVEQLASQFPRLRGRVQVQCHKLPWWKATTSLPQDLSLVFLGHVLNETPVSQHLHLNFWEPLFKRTQGGGVLLVEPAARRTSQQLSLLRNFLLESQVLEPTAQAIWGPCLHAGACPLAEGRDWCHFSVPIDIPGHWFKTFSRALSSERQWVKYSYVWLASREFPAPQSPSHQRRVVSDPLYERAHRNSQTVGPVKNYSAKKPARKPTARLPQPIPGHSTVLLCEPDQVARWNVDSRDPIHRGDIISVRV